MRKSINGTSYTIRFTPRKPQSIWTNVNIAKVQNLIDQNRISPAGTAAWALREEHRSGIYAFEEKAVTFDTDAVRAFRKNRKAWQFFQAQPPGLSSRRSALRRKRQAGGDAHSPVRDRAQAGVGDPLTCRKNPELGDRLGFQLDFLDRTELGEHRIRPVPYHDAARIRP